MSNEMPAFPIRPLFNSYDDEIDYERALREAYAARLREMHELMAVIPGRIQLALFEEFSGPPLAAIQDDIAALLKRIGPLPPPPEKG